MIFKAIAIDSVKLLETLDHVHEPRRAAQEILARYWVALKTGAHAKTATLAGADLGDLDAAARAIANGAHGAAGVSPVAGDKAPVILQKASRLVRALDMLIARGDAPFTPTPLANANGGEDFVTIEHGAIGVGKNFTVLTRAPGWPNPVFPVNQKVFPGLAIRDNLVIPRTFSGYTVRIRRLEDEERLSTLFAGESTLGYVGAYDGARQWPKAGTDFAPFAGDAGIDQEKRLFEIAAHVNAALDRDARVIVLPELTITRELQRRLVVGLVDKLEQHHRGKSALLLAGTAHVSTGGVKRNRAEVLWLDGEPVLTQDKLAPMRIADWQEGIVPGAHIEILVTPLGPLGVLICRDFCDALPQAGLHLLDRLDLGVILVPSMGDSTTTSAHKRRLEGPLERRVLVSQQKAFPKSPNFLGIRCVSELEEREGENQLFKNL